MIGFSKRQILRALNRSGYYLLKKDEYDRLSERLGANEPVTIAPEPELEQDRPTTPPLVVEPPSMGALAPNSASAREAALNALVTHVLAQGVNGCFVDCGDGSPHSLAVMAAVLASVGIFDRQLILYDTTGDPTHRPEPRFVLWGGDWDVMTEAAAIRSERERRETLPDELVATSYPSSNILIARFPRDVCDISDDIALLHLTAETYKAHRSAIRRLAPHVARNGIIAISDTSGGTRVKRVVELLEKECGALSFAAVGSDILMAVKR